MMLVRDLLLQAISRTNLSKRSKQNVPADILDNARDDFEFVLRKYCNSSVINAYQGWIEFTPESEKTIVGVPEPKRGCRLLAASNEDSKPDVTTLFAGRDFVRLVSDPRIVYAVVDNGGTNEYQLTTYDSFCDFVPDVPCFDFCETVCVGFEKDNSYARLRPSNYSSYKFDSRKFIYASNPVHVNAAEIFVKSTVGKKHLLVYNTEMRLSIDDFLAVPSQYYTLLDLAVSQMLCVRYSSIDQQKKADITALLEKEENEVMIRNMSNRMMMRDVNELECNPFRVDMYLD